jgi:DHA2 family multidrug resistance protein
MVTLVDHKTTTASARLTRFASPYNPIFLHRWEMIQTRIAAYGRPAAVAHVQALMVLSREISQQAAVVAFNSAFAVIALLFLVCLPLVWLLRRGRPPSETAAMPE